MPRVNLGHDLFLSDHWIRIYKDDEPAATNGAQVPSAKSPDRDEP